MEFYKTLAFEVCKNACFNSQRDGILLFPNSALAFVPFLFQFPTGWNSTLLREKIRDEKMAFQFPTGWNSTRLGCANEVFTLLCFNSQRDGILQSDTPWTPYFHAFQFPTGWNSTYRSILESLSFYQFQFPTGWNSTCTQNSSSRAIDRFQFPTGWNSTQKTLRDRRAG